VSVVVSLRNVAEELDALMEGFQAYLNKETAEVSVISLDDIRLLDSADDFDDSDLPDWHLENLAHTRDVLDSQDWVRLPSKFDIHDWALMEDFSQSVDDPALRDELLAAIRGPGAFRHFRDAVDRHGIRDSWLDFKLTALEQIAASWLDRLGVAYSRDGS